MLNLTAAFMSAKPHEQKKIHVFAEAFVCHIDETALFSDNVNINIVQHVYFSLLLILGVIGTH
jgi:hypothetical protein